jgi:hypothetical protein
MLEIEPVLATEFWQLFVTGNNAARHISCECCV